MVGSFLQWLRRQEVPQPDPFRVRRPAPHVPIVVSGSEVVPLEESTAKQWERTQRGVTPEERSKLESDAESCAALLGRYVSDPDVPFQAIPAALDVVFAKWLEEPENTREPPDQILDQCGALFGEFLIKYLDLEWQVITDDIGTDYAVWNRGTGSYGWPFATIRKRIRSGENNFFHSVFLLLKERASRT